MTIDTNEPLAVGSVFDKFLRIDGRLAKGGMGLVYRAFHLLLKQPVALKVITPMLLDRPGVAARFDREMEAVARLDHPNVVRVLHAGEADGRRYLVMELVDGENLETVVRQRGPLPIAEAVDLARQVALGLQHAHENGVVHRDIKPLNLMVTANWNVKILDFGLARFQADEDGAEVSDGITQPGQGLGSPDYMAPEQVVNGRTADIRADLYGLGASLFHLLSGRAPFGDVQGKYEKMKAHESRPAPDVRSLRPEVPARLAELLVRLMAKNPDDRPSTPAEVAQALTGWDLPAMSGDVTVTPTPLPKPWPVWKIVCLGSAGLLVGALALVLVLWLWTGPRATITSFEVTRRALVAGETVESVLGVNTFSARLDDHATVKVRLSKPAYGYLLAYAADGKEHLLDPQKSDEKPIRSDLLVYPLENQGVDYALNDDVGLHLFVAVISSRPLPAYGDWKKQRGVASWGNSAGWEGQVLRQVGGDLHAVAAKPDERGPGAAALEVGPVGKLAAWWRKQPGIEEVGLTGFTVTKAD